VFPKEERTNNSLILVPSGIDVFTTGGTVHSGFTCTHTLPASQTRPNSTASKRETIH